MWNCSAINSCCEWDARKTLLISPLASVSEPEDLLWRSEYFLALLFAAHCWLRVTMRSDEKLDSATVVDASATASRASSAPTAAGELLCSRLQLSRKKERKGDVFKKHL